MRQDDRPTFKKRVGIDLQAVMTILGRRTVTHDPSEPWRLDLGGVHLRAARLHGAHLKRANLYHAHLERANLNGAHLEGANLLGAHLEGARLHSAHLDGANLDNVTWSYDTTWPVGFHPERVQRCVDEDSAV